MDQTDFAIAMVSSVIIIIAIFLFILLKIFEKKKKTRHIVTLLPENTKIKKYESQPEKFVIKPKENEELEKNVQISHEFQKENPVIEMMGEKKEERKEEKKEERKEDKKEKTMKVSTEPINEISNFQQADKLNQDNESLKLEDILIDIQNEKIKKKTKKKISLNKNPGKSENIKERETSQKKPKKRPTRKKPQKKVNMIEKINEIMNENPGTAEL